MCPHSRFRIEEMYVSVMISERDEWQSRLLLNVKLITVSEQGRFRWANESVMGLPVIPEVSASRF